MKTLIKLIAIVDTAEKKLSGVASPSPLYCLRTIFQLGSLLFVFTAGAADKEQPASPASPAVAQSQTTADTSDIESAKPALNELSFSGDFLYGQGYVTFPFFFSLHQVNTPLINLTDVTPSVQTPPVTLIMLEQRSPTLEVGHGISTFHTRMVTPVATLILRPRNSVHKRPGSKSRIIGTKRICATPFRASGQPHSPPICEPA
jgi:hypothetical protein